MRDKNQFKNIFHHLFLIPRLSFTPDSAAEQHRRMEDGVCSQFIKLCLCCSFLLSLFPYSTVGSLPQGTDLQKWTAAVWIPSGIPVGDPQVLTENLLQQGCCSIGHRSWQEPAHHWLSTGCSFLQDIFTSSREGSSTRTPEWISPPPRTSMGYRETICIAMAFTTGCRRIFAPVPGAPPFLPSSLIMVSEGLFYSHTLTPLSAVAGFFLPFLKYFIMEVLTMSLTGSASASGRSVLELGGTGSLKHGSSF